MVVRKQMVHNILWSVLDIAFWDTPLYLAMALIKFCTALKKMANWSNLCAEPMHHLLLYSIAASRLNSYLSIIYGLYCILYYKLSCFNSPPPYLIFLFISNNLVSHTNFTEMSFEISTWVIRTWQCNLYPMYKCIKVKLISRGLH